jgi:hypothetical protein
MMLRHATARERRPACSCSNWLFYLSVCRSCMIFGDARAARIFELDR